MRTAGPLASSWLARAYHEVARERHLVLHGNIEDLVCWQGEYRPLRPVLDEFLTVHGYPVVGHFDLVEGLTFSQTGPGDFVRTRLSGTTVDTGNAPSSNGALPSGAPVPRSIITTNPADVSGGASEPAGPESARRVRLSQSARRVAASLSSNETLSIRTTSDMLGAASHLLQQKEHACAVVIEQADLLFGPTAVGSERHQADLVHLSKLLAEAEVASSRRPGEQLRNIVVLVSKGTDTLPAWIYRDNPHCASIRLGSPVAAERAGFVGARLHHYAREADDAVESASAVAEIATLTDGMSILDLKALEATSRLTKIPLSSSRRLVARHRFGIRDDPWEQLDIGKVRSAGEILRRRVMGQDRAVSAVADMLVNARVGLDFQAEADRSATRPKGVFFFVGPMGVGKTELAKAIAELVFEDEAALRRFDMSEFSQEHASERFTGAPPGYVGHESGGVLTNWMLERPFSVVLFDEIEKAHARIFDKFLQVIDDGRLTDGQGRTAYFSQSVVIFTSNLGAGTLPSLTGGNSVPPPYASVAGHFEEAVRRYFTETLGRPELLGRLGSGVVAFDILRPEVVTGIVQKFLGQLQTACESRGYDVVFDSRSIESAVTEELGNSGLSMGARQIRSPVLDRLVRVPLNRWIVANDPEPGTRIWVHRTSSGEPFTVEPFPSIPGAT